MQPNFWRGMYQAIYSKKILKRTQTPPQYNPYTKMQSAAWQRAAHRSRTYEKATEVFKASNPLRNDELSVRICR